MGFHSERHHRTSDGARIDVDQRATKCILALQSRRSASERLLADRQRAADVIDRDSRHAALAVEGASMSSAVRAVGTFQKALPSN